MRTPQEVMVGSPREALLTLNKFKELANKLLKHYKLDKVNLQCGYGFSKLHQ